MIAKLAARRTTSVAHLGLVLLALSALIAAGCGNGTPATSAAAAPASPTPAQPAATPRGLEATFSYDRKAPLAATAKLQSETEFARIEKVSYRGADGQRVPGLLSIPKGKSGRVPCIFGAHYLTGTAQDILYEKESYAARGAALFVIDARYHGERQGSIGPEKAASRLDTLYKLYRFTVIDMRRGLDYLEKRGICDPARIGFEGRSLGGFMGSMLIGADRRIKAAVLYVSGADWRRYFSKSYAVLGGPLSGRKLDQAVLKMRNLDPKYWIPRAKGRPVFMANGRTDEQTPFASAQALHRAAREPKQVLVYDGGHDIEEPHATRIAKAVDAFLKRYLRIPAG